MKLLIGEKESLNSVAQREYKDERILTVNISVWLTRKV
jgi:hypothetical protein